MKKTLDLTQSQWVAVKSSIYFMISGKYSINGALVWSCTLLSALC